MQTIKNIFGSSIYFACLESIKQRLRQNQNLKKKPILVNLISAAISRTAQMLSVAPIVVIKTRFEVSGFNKYNGLIDAVTTIRREEGYGHKV